LADVRDQVAQELSVRAIRKAVPIEGVKIGVYFTLPKSEDEHFLSQVASHIKHTLLLQQYLFAVASTGASCGTIGKICEILRPPSIGLLTPHI
jgi:hypothetical protein